jgi:hypothetical protein
VLHNLNLTRSFLNCRVYIFEKKSFHSWRFSFTRSWRTSRECAKNFHFVALADYRFPFAPGFITRIPSSVAVRFITSRDYRRTSPKALVECVFERASGSNCTINGAQISPNYNGHK